MHCKCQQSAVLLAFASSPSCHALLAGYAPPSYSTLVLLRSGERKNILCESKATLTSSPRYLVNSSAQWRDTRRRTIFASSIDDMDTEEGKVEDDLELPKQAKSDSPSLSTDEDKSVNESAEDLTTMDEGKKDSDENDVRSFFVQGKESVGIGGADGFVYDVNALKRNLVQESIRESKRELLVLLGAGREVRSNQSPNVDPSQRDAVPLRWQRDRDDLIEDRLSTLIQTNPVSTTTDSNILDGDWGFAFQTNSASTILDTSRLLLSKTKRKNNDAQDVNGKNEVVSNNGENALPRGGPWKFRLGKTENPFRSSTRQIYLENLAEDEDAHIVDKTRVFGGFLEIKRRYGVYGLTRTALDLDLEESETRLMGILVKANTRDDFKDSRYGAPLEVHIIYLDTDLCICTTGTGLDGPLHVYTKSDLWATERTQRKLRLLAQTASWISTLQSPLRIRQRLANAFTINNDTRYAIYDPDLKAYNIGELDINDDGTTREDPSWDGDDDPFYHLTPTERMDVLRTMSLHDIYKAGLNRKLQSKKEKRRRWSRSKTFKKPEQ